MDHWSHLFFSKNQVGSGMPAWFSNYLIMIALLIISSIIQCLITMATRENLRSNLHFGAWSNEWRTFQPWHLIAVTTHLNFFSIPYLTYFDNNLNWKKYILVFLSQLQFWIEQFDKHVFDSFFTFVTRLSVKVSSQRSTPLISHFYDSTKWNMFLGHLSQYFPN